jgi:hypothetical protein
MDLGTAKRYRTTRKNIMTLIWLLSTACMQKEPTQTEIDVGLDEPSSEASTEPSTEPSSEASTEPSTEPSSDPNSGPLEIIGSYIDNYSTEHVITATSWLLDYGSQEQYFYSITQYSNTDQYVIAENDESNGSLEAGKWSRFDWTYDASNSLWVCQTTSDALSEELALSTEAPDKSNPSEVGCRNYGWMHLY